MHHDVYLSNSWSANVFGAKLWLLFHPRDLRNLKDKWDSSFLPDARVLPLVQDALRNHLAVMAKNSNPIVKEILDIIQRDFILHSSPNVDKAVFPFVDEVRSVKIAIQMAGEVIFVPSGWVHQVHNIGESLCGG